MKRLFPSRLVSPSLFVLLAALLAISPALEMRTARAQDGAANPAMPVQGGTPGSFVGIVPLDPPDTGLESVIGTDQRKRVSPTTGKSVRWVVKLEVTFPSGSGGCSGWFVDPKLVMTAGHCVYNGSDWATSIRVIPAKNKANEPYGSQTVPQSALWSTGGWVFSGDTDYDYGAIVLPDTTLSDAMGGVVMDYAALSSYFLLNELGQVNVTGYPGDLATAVSGVTGWTMWTDRDPVTGTTSEKVHYTIDTFGGESGSAVWGKYKGKKFAIGVHAYGVGIGSPCLVDPTSGVMNCGARVDLDMVNNFIGFFGSSANFYTDLIDAPVILTPPDFDLTNQKINFSWNLQPDAAKYEVNIWKYNPNTFAWKSIIKKKTANLSWLKSLGNGFYAWRVRIEQANKFPGQWSAFYFFEVDKKKPGKPKQALPVKNTVMADSTPHYFWTLPADTDLASIEIVVNDKPGGWNSPVLSIYIFSPTATDYEQFTSLPDGKYWWRMRVQDEAGNYSGWTSKWKFQVVGGGAIALGESFRGLTETVGTPPVQTQSSNIPVMIPLEAGASSAPAGDSAPVISID
jgi:V8-like Glu-specific endopeptidase